MKKIITLLAQRATPKSILFALWLCAGNILPQSTLLHAMQAPIIEVEDEEINNNSLHNSEKISSNNPTNIDFEVRALGNRRFMVSFINKDSRVHIRIYDVIGNLIKDDHTTQRGRFSQEYDMSKSKSEVYIVEVGDTKYSTTKRIFLN